MHLTDERRSIEQIRDMGAQELIGWALEHFDEEKIVLSTGFGMEGCVLIDMASSLSSRLKVFYLDTGFFFRETYALIDQLKERYPGVSFIDAGTTLTPALQEAKYGAKLWERDPDLCCLLRKVMPMKELLKDADAWLTAVRNDQSPHRSEVRKVQWNATHQVWKIAPFASWSRSRIWDYIRSRDVPHNRLHHEGYPSIGCMQCTKRVPGTAVNEYSRKGRWADFEKTECGLHL